MTDRPYAQPSYMDVDQVPFVITMHQLYKDNKLDSIQSVFFREKRPEHELYNLKKDPFELKNLANDPSYAEILNRNISILDNWMRETDDKGQYPENEENLKLMLGIWGDHAVNPEYQILRNKYPNLASSQFYLKSEKWQEVKN